MVWIGCGDPNSDAIGKNDGVNRIGSYLGIMGQSPADMSGKAAEIHAGDRLTAQNYGQRIARSTQRWQKS